MLEILAPVLGALDLTLLERALGTGHQEACKPSPQYETVALEHAADTSCGVAASVHHPPQWWRIDGLEIDARVKRRRRLAWKYAIQTFDGHYLTATGGGGQTVERIPPLFPKLEEAA